MLYEIYLRQRFAKILESHGWVLLGVNGSHHIYGRAGSEVRLSVPIHANKTLKTGLLKHLMTLAELTEDDLYNLNAAQ